MSQPSAATVPATGPGHNDAGRNDTGASGAKRIKVSTGGRNGDGRDGDGNQKAGGNNNQVGNGGVIAHEEGKAGRSEDMDGELNESVSAIPHSCQADCFTSILRLLILTSGPCWCVCAVSTANVSTANVLVCALYRIVFFKHGRPYPLNVCRQPVRVESYQRMSVMRELSQSARLRIHELPKLRGRPMRMKSRFKLSI